MMPVLLDWLIFMTAVVGVVLLVIAIFPLTMLALPGSVVGAISGDAVTVVTTGVSRCNFAGDGLVMTSVVAVFGPSDAAMALS